MAIRTYARPDQTGRHFPPSIFMEFCFHFIRLNDIPSFSSSSSFSFPVTYKLCFWSYQFLRSGKKDGRWTWSSTMIKSRRFFGIRMRESKDWIKKNEREKHHVGLLKASRRSMCKKKGNQLTARCFCSCQLALAEEPSRSSTQQPTTELPLPLPRLQARQTNNFFHLTLLTRKGLPRDTEKKQKKEKHKQIEKVCCRTCVVQSVSAQGKHDFFAQI